MNNDDRAKFEAWHRSEFPNEPLEWNGYTYTRQQVMDRFCGFRGALASAQAASAEQVAPCAASCLAAGGGTQDDYCNLTQGECARKLTTPAPAVAPAAVTDEMLKCEVKPRPLAYPLSDYHHAPSEGPLHFQWTDKPHRLLYDLIAAVRYYATRTPEPQAERDATPASEADLKVYGAMTESYLRDTGRQPDSRGQAREGWRWVPVEPTKEMIDAAGTPGVSWIAYTDLAFTVWRSMLAASPAPDEQRAQAAQAGTAVPNKTADWQCVKDAGQAAACHMQFYREMMGKAAPQSSVDVEAVMDELMTLADEYAEERASDAPVATHPNTKEARKWLEDAIRTALAGRQQQ